MRNNKVDILRFIGLAMIIFAHVGPPGILFQLRNFDVPLMVLVSGMSFGLSYKSNEPYGSYVWKRIKRLVFPVWIFLTGYFIAQFLVFPNSPELNLKTIITSYAFILGPVWVIRVFLLVACVAPLLFVWHKKTQSDNKYFSLLTICLLLYEFLRYISLRHIKGVPGEIVLLIINYIIPYAIIFSIGLRMMQMSKRQLYALSLISFGLLIFVGMGLFLYTGKVITTQELKYPPSIYYLAYSLFVSILLWIFGEQTERWLDTMKIKDIVLFIANNSIWIYLWHIPLIEAVHTNFALKYVIIFTVAVSITYAQTWVVGHLLMKRIHSDRLRKNIKTLLTG